MLVADGVVGLVADGFDAAVDVASICLAQNRAVSAIKPTGPAPKTATLPRAYPNEGGSHSHGARRPQPGHVARGATAPGRTVPPVLHAVAARRSR